MPAPVASGWSDIAGWGLHPLESAAFSRRTPEADAQPSLWEPLFIPPFPSLGMGNRIGLRRVKIRGVMAQVPVTGKRIYVTE